MIFYADCKTRSCGLIYVVFVIALSFRGVGSQILRLYPPESPPSPSVCDEGLAAGKERFLIRAQANLTEAADPHLWQELVVSLEFANGSHSLCTITMHGGCHKLLPHPCYCSSNSNGQIYDLVFNLTASVEYSTVVVRATWKDSNLNYIYSTSNQTLPEMNDPNFPGDALTVNSEGNLNLINCDFQMYSSINNAIDFCVGEKAAVYNITLSFESYIVASNNGSDHCISGTFTVSVGDLTEGIFSINYSKDSGCIRQRNYGCAVTKDVLLQADQDVTLRNPVAGSECLEGVREGDMVIWWGKITGASGLNMTQWQEVEFVTKKNDDVNFQAICSWNLLECSQIENNTCFCAAQSDDAYVLRFYMKAELRFSEAEAKLVWRKVFGVPAVLESTPIRKGLKIYDKNSEVITLTVNDEEKTLKQSCELPGGASEYKMSFCCTNSPSPCNLKLKHGHGEIIGSSCINHTVEASKMYTFSYSVCGIQYDTGKFVCTVALSTSHEGGRTTQDTNTISIVLLCLLAAVISAGSLYIVVRKKEQPSPPLSSPPTSPRPQPEPATTAAIEKEGSGTEMQPE